MEKFTNEMRPRHTLPTLFAHSWITILQAFSHFTYVTAHSDSSNFPSLHLRHSSFSNPSLILSTSQLILQPFRCFTYVTAHSPTLLSPLLRHRIFTWRAAHDIGISSEVIAISFTVIKVVTKMPLHWKCAPCGS